MSLNDKSNNHASGGQQQQQQCEITTVQSQPKQLETQQQPAVLASQQRQQQQEKPEIITEQAYKQILTEQLEQKGSGGSFVWIIFALCVTPNILNGFHVSSYTLLGHLPDDQWCEVNKLQGSNWTYAQRRNISQGGLSTHGCTVWNWDYAKLSVMPYEEAYEYSRKNSPVEASCTDNGVVVYEAPETTFVADWGLVCDHALQRTSAQVFVSLGKFFGSFSFGIFSDKFGRKKAFTLGSTFFIVSSLLCTFSPWYSLFLVGRFGLGSASSGLFYPAFTMVVENICLKHRSWMSIAFSASYPIGIIILAVAAFYVQQWRYLQFTLTVPAFLLILNCYLLFESPRWLIARKKYDRAYKILFKRKSHFEIQPTSKIASNNTKENSTTEKQVPLWQSLRQGPLKQFISLYATRRMRRLIFTSYFMFCVTSLCYYVTALNASNMRVSRFLYVATTGMVDLPSYLVPVIMLKFTGRRITTMCLFLLTGVALLLVLAVPTDNNTLIVSFAMLGRFGISATYAIVTLYTAELYPTEIRNSALGTCSTWAHVGSISAPYVVDVLGILGWYIPTTICGCCVLIAAVLTLTLPETGCGKLSDHVDKAHSKSEVQLETITSSNNCPTPVK